VINVSGDKVLTIGFAGRMAVHKKADCVPIPVMPPKVKKGDMVMARSGMGSFSEAKVEGVDAAIGRIFVIFVKQNKTKKVGIAFGDVIAKLPQK
jgi:hypothetical protein